MDAVVRGTPQTLQQFPNRRLLCKDIGSAGNAGRGFLSLHRIVSALTHRGDGALGPATQRPAQVRTVADCVCLYNRIVHEWLVRDQGALPLQLGSTPQALARTWLDDKRARPLPLWQPLAPQHWHDPMHATPGALLLADTLPCAVSRQPGCAAAAR